MTSTVCDVFINVVKRKEALLYRSSVAPAAANLAYVSGAVVDIPTCLSISDRSTSLAANRATRSNYTTITGTKNFTIDTDNFVVTDVFTNATNTINSTPLFYKHVLGLNNLPRENTILYTLSSSVKILDVQILDLAFQPVKVTELYLDSAVGVIYNNLAPYFTSASKYNYYYVKYSVSVAGAVSTYIEMLNNQTAYRLASYTDLDSDLQIIRDGRKVYLIDETETGFEVTLPIIGTYAFKPLSTARIQVTLPIANSTEEPWYVRISNGKFYAVLDGTVYKYYIAEFNNQTFYPEAPYKRTTQSVPLVLNAVTLKMDNTNIVEIEDLDMGMSIEFSTVDGDGIAAFTTLDTYVGTIASNGMTFQKWSKISPIGIRSIDNQNGFVDIDGLALDSAWDITATYYFAETSYEVSLINFNPVSNKEALTTKIAFFIDPDSGSIVKDQTIYYLKIDQSGKVIESNWPAFDNNTEQAYGEDIYFGDPPSWKPAGPTRTNFLTVYSTEGSGTYLVLAEVVAAVGSSSQDMGVLDSRIRGGGIVEDKFTEAQQLAPEASWCWDTGQWDGTPFPGNATYLVEVPSITLESAGGNFTQQEVTDIIKRHTALGIYPVIRTYGNEITVSGIAWHDPRSDIEWAGF